MSAYRRVGVRGKRIGGSACGRVGVRRLLELLRCDLEKMPKIQMELIRRHGETPTRRPVSPGSLTRRSADPLTRFPTRRSAGERGRGNRSFSQFSRKIEKVTRYGNYESSNGGFPVLFANGYGCFWLLEEAFGVRSSAFGVRGALVSSLLAKSPEIHTEVAIALHGGMEVL